MSLGGLKKVLLTGGMGYIGSHTATLLLDYGYEVVLYDNLSNSSIDVKDKIQEISNREVYFVEGDLIDNELLTRTLKDFNIDIVIHFAGKKSVGESVEKPINYFENNISGSISLLRAMERASVQKIVFSSSAMVYGDPEYLPYDENHPKNPINPYGKSKLFIEETLKDVCASNPDFSAICLRYFNPIGSHESGLIGESPSDKPNNLMPCILDVATGKLNELKVYGGDYSTKDGTAIRDYIHVMDLVNGHLKGILFLDKNFGWHAFNLGTGVGYSVLDVVKSFEDVNQIEIPYKIVERRMGDIAKFYSSSIKANNILQWYPEKGIRDMCLDVWRTKKNQRD